MRYFNKLDWSIPLSVLSTCALTVVLACVEASGPLGAPNVVESPQVSSVKMTLAKPALAPGQTTQVTVVAKSADGKVIPGPVDFSSKSPSIATVSSNGVVTAVTTGVATIQATVASRFDTASVTVQSVAPTVASVTVALDSTSLTVGHGAKASAVAKDAAGNVIAGQAVTWTSLSPAVATVSSTGAVLAVAPGSATIKGTITGISGSASLTVAPVSHSVTTVVVAIDSSTLAVGHSAQASAAPKDAAGITIVGQAVTWVSLTPAVATVSPSGVVTAVSAGSVAIQATVSGVAGSASIDVVDPITLPDSAFLVGHDFNDSTVGPFNNYGGADLDFPNDPTNLGKGKVARFHYKWAGSTGINHDENRSVEYTRPIHFGDTLYFKGEFYFPAGTDLSSPIQRKLLYWQNHTLISKYGWNSAGSPMYASIVVMFGDQLCWNGIMVAQPGSLLGNVDIMAWNLATIVAGRWYTLEKRITTETSIGAGDGVVQIWLDGNLIFTKTDMRWSDPAWIGQPLPGGNGKPYELTDLYFSRFFVGDQANYSGNFDEYRYWDNIKFSNQWIP